MVNIPELVLKQRAYFFTNETKSIAFRITQLKKLKSAIITHQQKIADALFADLHKSYEEAYLSEISIVLNEINYHLKNVASWSKAKAVHTPYYLLPSKSKVILDPLGLSLIIAPWNYPFQLVINPLIGAISAGCCAIVKPSPYTPTVSALLKELLTEVFDEKYIAVVEGGRTENAELLAQRFDVIFFTGSSAFGKEVMRAAAENLTPVILELGGKSPCIVDETANIKVAAKRIIWGKLINAGQTCIAPDYLFVHQNVKNILVKEMIAAAKEMYGEDFKSSKYYPRIVNDKAFERLVKLIDEGNILWGAEHDATSRYISPTILDNVAMDTNLMRDEIFGPILPVFTYQKIEEVIQYINKNEKPLALYYFGKNTEASNVLARTSAGGGCVNDTLLHIANHHLPFGGVGNSGMGKYHGEGSFLAFSNQRSILSSVTWIDIAFKYPPFKYFNVVKKFI